jgi:hypothetical protein
MQHTLSLRTVTGRLTCLALVLLVALLAMALSAPDVAHAAVAHPPVFHPLALGAMALGTSLSPSPTVAPAAFSGYLPAELERRGNLRAFFVPIRWAPIAAGAAGIPGQLIADPNHDIVITKMAYTARLAADNSMQDRPLLLAELSLGSNLLYTPGQGKAVELETIAGVNRGEREFVIPIVIPAGETFTVNLTNGSALILNVQLDLLGGRSARSRQ